MPKVSVIIPAYNAGAFIGQTLTSVKDQILQDWECIIVDDGSTDHTGAYVRDWIKQDNRFRYVHQDNKGLSGARNTGLETATGEYIQFLDADDIILPAKLSNQLNALPAGKKAVSYTDYKTGLSSDIFEPSAFYLSPALQSSDYLPELVSKWETVLIIPPHCFLFSASIFVEDGIRFDTELPNHEDFDCWVTILKTMPVLSYVDEKLCIYRITEGSMSKNMRSMGEGFLQVLDKQIKAAASDEKLLHRLRWKRRETLQRYKRFDKMSVGEKIISWKSLFKYYKKRLF